MTRLPSEHAPLPPSSYPCLCPYLGPDSTYHATWCEHPHLRIRFPSLSPFVTDQLGLHVSSPGPHFRRCHHCQTLSDLAPPPPPPPPPPGLPACALPSPHCHLFWAIAQSFLGARTHVTSCALHSLARARFASFISHSSLPPDSTPALGSTARGPLPFPWVSPGTYAASPRSLPALCTLRHRTGAPAWLSSLLAVQGLVLELRKLGPGVRDE